MRSAPTISVVIATRNRAERLSRLLDALRAQTLGREAFEVIVVDDGSRDETPALLEREADRDELALRTVTQDASRGPAGARNAGWRAASGSFIAFTDDDCMAHPCWLEALRAAANSRLDVFVQGRTDPAPDELSAMGVFSRTIQVDELGPFFQTCNVGYPRSLLEELGGFDERTFARHPGGEDTDLAWRAIARGAEPVFAPDARVFHAVNYLGPTGGLRLALRWSDTMALFARHVGLRSQLHRGMFWKRSHELLLRALIGLLLARRFPPAALLAYPYVRTVVRRTRRRGSPAVYAPYVAMQDLFETYAALRGAVRHRVLVL
jgi:glycosyltransferase involved in cell wall biosynthesis